MKQQRIVVDISRDGRITADAEGFSGDACLRDLERLLDGLASWESVDRKDSAGEQKGRVRRSPNVDLGRNA